MVSACREIEVEGARGRGRGRKTKQECVTGDMRREAAQDRAVWRGAIFGKRLTLAIVDNGNKYRRKTNKKHACRCTESSSNLYS